MRSNLKISMMLASFWTPLMLLTGCAGLPSMHDEPFADSTRSIPAGELIVASEMAGTAEQAPTVRGQGAGSPWDGYPADAAPPRRNRPAEGRNPQAPGSNSQYRYPMAPNDVRGGATANGGNPRAQTAPYRGGAATGTTQYQPNLPPPPGRGTGNANQNQNQGQNGPFEPLITPYGQTAPVESQLLEPPGTEVPLDVIVEETRTGRFMFGVGVNSDAGLTGQVVVDERNFDLFRPPRSLAEVLNGEAWRGAGQGFRLEALPGNQVQRYMVSFTEPYLLGYLPISMNVSGYFFDRRYFDWDEQRVGGRASLGYRLTPDLSLAGTFRGENVDIHDPRIRGVEDLEEVLGDNELYTGRVSLTHDTRDVPFLPTEGHLVELAYEQAFGSFDYPRFEADFRKYFLMRERPDGSGRHTLAYNFRVGMSGAQTPIFENYFAGGFSTMRGFDFRGASPVEGGVTVGGEFRFLGSVEYMFPLTADDMVRGVFFCDFGTVEEEIELHASDYRVAPGFGLRLSIPALGPAPLALDLAFPVAREDTDDVQNFSFFFGFGRG